MLNPQSYGVSFMTTLTELHASTATMCQASVRVFHSAFHRNSLRFIDIFLFFFSQNHTGYVEKYVASVNQTELACRFTRRWDGVGTFSLRIYIRLIFFYCVKAIFQKGILFFLKDKDAYSKGRRTLVMLR